MPEMAKQGVHGDHHYAGHMYDTARRNVTIDHRPVDPHTDVAPTHSYELEIREVPRTFQTGADALVTRTAMTACCLDVGGRCAGLLAPHRLQLLWDRFQYVTAHHTDLVAKLEPRTFPEEVYRLLQRYRCGADRDDCTRSVKAANHWATPAPVMNVLHKHFGVSKERFASPLNFNEALPEYWACHERDQLFGARWNSYSCAWTGVSQANPEYEHEDMDKAVRWALTSASGASDEANLTVMVLPAWSDGSNCTSYHRHIRAHPDKCHVLFRIRKQHFAFCRPEAWQGMHTYAGNPKWDVNILLVGNAAGMRCAQAVDANVLCDDMVRALRTVRHTMLANARATGGHTDTNAQGTRVVEAGPLTSRTHLNFRPLRTNLTPTEVRVPRRFARLPADECRRRDLAGLQNGQWGDVRGIFAAWRPLLVDASSLVYTDGSVVTMAGPPGDDKAPGGTGEMHPLHLASGRVTIAGAGVYIPPRAPASEGLHTPLDPGNREGTVTITRAEGAAIWLALRDGLGTAIATDSATMLYQIHNMLMRPHTMRHSRNKALVAEIIDMVRRSPEPIRLYKVKAHTGIPGNEHADWAARQATHRLAKQAATGPPTAMDEDGPWETMPECTVSLTPPWHVLHWPHQVREGQHAAYRAVPDLRGHLKAVVAGTCRLGYSNADSIYYQSWVHTLPKADGAVSNSFMRSCRDAADGSKRRLTLQYRSGGLYTAKMRHRMKKADTPNCVLCGQLDGGHHSLSGCPHLSGLYVNRHNDAGKLLLRYITKGSKGASVVMHDVGKHDPAPADAPGGSQAGPQIPARIPDWVYATGPRDRARDRQQWHTYRPDIMLVTGGPHRPVHKRTVHIVELKYCRDTDWHGQHERATGQHEDLTSHLTRVGYLRNRVHLHTVLLGVGGTIYRNMYDTLKQLGVNRTRGKLLGAKLHRNAVTHAHVIMHTKWQQEAMQPRHQAGVG